MSLATRSAWFRTLALVAALGLATLGVTQGDASSPANASPEDVHLELSGLQEAYRPGDTVRGSISLRMVDPDRTVGRAVAFLNVVEAREPWPQAGHLIVAEGEITPEIFQTVYDRSAWIEGIEAEATLKLRDDAPAGSYHVVFQIFAGTNTDPHDVDPAARLALQSFPIEITD